MDQPQSPPIGKLLGQALEKAKPNAASEPISADVSECADLAPADLFKRLECGPAGLSADEAAARLKKFGPNQIDTAKRKHLLIAFLERLANPLVAILLFAAGISALTGDVASFVVIAVIVLVSIILDVTQERQAQHAAERLRARVSLSIKVLRDGKELDIPSVEAVPGDVVLLAAGDLIPADCRLLEGARSLCR